MISYQYVMRMIKLGLLLLIYLVSNAVYGQTKEIRIRIWDADTYEPIPGLLCDIAIDGEIVSLATDNRGEIYLDSFRIPLGTRLTIFPDEKDYRIERGDLFFYGYRIFLSTNMQNNTILLKTNSRIEFPISHTFIFDQSELSSILGAKAFQIVNTDNNTILFKDTIVNPIPRSVNKKKYALTVPLPPGNILGSNIEEPLSFQMVDEIKSIGQIYTKILIEEKTRLTEVDLSSEPAGADIYLIRRLLWDISNELKPLKKKIKTSKPLTPEELELLSKFKVNEGKTNLTIYLQEINHKAIFILGDKIKTAICRPVSAKPKNVLTIFFDDE